MGNNEPAVDQSDLRIRGSYGLNIYILARRGRHARIRLLRERTFHRASS